MISAPKSAEQTKQDRCYVCGEEPYQGMSILLDGHWRDVCEICWSESGKANCPVCGERLPDADGGLCEDCLFYKNEEALTELDMIQGP